MLKSGRDRKQRGRYADLYQGKRIMGHLLGPVPEGERLVGNRFRSGTVLDTSASYVWKS